MEGELVCDEDEPICISLWDNAAQGCARAIHAKKGEDINGEELAIGMGMNEALYCRTKLILPTVT